MEIFYTVGHKKNWDKSIISDNKQSPFTHLRCFNNYMLAKLKAEKISKNNGIEYNVYIVEAEKYESKISYEDDDSFVLTYVYGTFKKLNTAKRCFFSKTKIDIETLHGYSKIIYNEYINYYALIKENRIYTPGELYFVFLDFYKIQLSDVTFMMLEMLQAGLLEMVAL